MLKCLLCRGLDDPNSIYRMHQLYCLKGSDKIAGAFPNDEALFEERLPSFRRSAAAVSDFNGFYAGHKIFVLMQLRYNFYLAVKIQT